MDRYEYKTKIEEMKKLIRDGKKQEAVDLVESMNWSRVHNVSALLSASSIYQEVGRLQDSKELLLLAHERSPMARMIIYHLALVCIEQKELEEAASYYDEFVEIAPHDTLKYLIKYRMNKAKGADINTLIGVLEELKDKEFLEEWSYELAYLYHKSNQIDKCILLCDEIILWFGEGPFVERALELKMLYQPLDKMQEDKYRQFQLKKEGITEIKANEFLGSGEIIPRTITIPEIELPPERFNTVNLQAEIKKNIEEIMNATEAGEVSENMENIKMLVEEIPYLQVETELPEEEDSFSKEENSLLDVFQGYLAEQSDGQISLLVPEGKETEEQVSGQLSIDEAMEEWEKTKRAAEAALEEAKQIELEKTKANAIKHATQIMDRLEDVIPKLDAGVSPTELLKEEYLAEKPQEEKLQEDSPREENTSKENSLNEGKHVSLVMGESFDIPKIAAEGVAAGVGLSIPVLHNQEKTTLEEKKDENPILAKTSIDQETKQWKPPVLEEKEDVDIKEATKIVEDVNQMLQKEIDRLSEEVQAQNQKMEESQEASSESQEEIIESKPDNTKDLIEVTEETVEDLPIIQEIQLEPEEMAELFDHNMLEKAVEEEKSLIKLTEEEKELFSYFLPVSGMETSITQVLTGATYYLEKGVLDKGNIIVQGEKGSGKTTLSMGLIKVLQNDTEKINNRVGKITGEKLNEKDLTELMSKVAGGALIIEEAGSISKETAIELSLWMEQQTERTLIIIEDTKEHIEKVLQKDTSFAHKFTEKISIPIYTIDELVEFGKSYALEEGFTVDEMAVLAMYNRINLIQKADRPTSILEVQEIMESAMDKAEKIGLKSMFGRLGSKKYDKEGNLILREQDFEI